MALRRTTGRNQKKRSRGSKPVLLFWLVFFIAIISVFLLQKDSIKENFNLFKSRLTTAPGSETPLSVEEELIEAVVEQPPPAPVETTVLSQTTERPQETKPPPPQPESKPTAPPPKPVTPEPQPPAQTRDRNIYFSQIDKDGQILRSRVTRKIPVSNTPLNDAIIVLLAGPSADELGRGILSFIPKNTRLLSATVKGSTASLNFSDDFLINTFGVEGYVAQLRQIVWTATEFDTVDSVQIMIEGRVMDYLGEGIVIGSPISR